MSFHIVLRAMAMAWLVACSFQASADQDLVFQKIEIATSWINQALQNTRGRSANIHAQLLPMDVANYKRYIETAYPTQNDYHIGEPALSAFFQAGGKMDAKQRDVCFMLYNPKAKTDLLTQLISPYETLFGTKITPYVFMAAHEMAHCIEFQENKAVLHKRTPLAMEVAADSFAILLLRAAGTPIEEIVPIIASRKNNKTTHATWPWLQRAMAEPIPSPRPELIEEIWKLADNISELEP